MNLVMDPADVTRFRDAVARHFGLQFDDTKLGLLEELLRGRLDAIRQTPAAYLATLEREVSRSEMGALAQGLTVPETYFFRHIDQFHAFAQIALPERLRVQAASKSLRLLSAGCASGEEAYSLAMIARESVPNPSWQVSIRAVDINPIVLQKAARARFTTWALRETPADMQRRWFRAEGRDFVVDEAVRTVTFEQRNLAVEDPELWQPASYDVIFCRNVLMYFAPQQAHALVTRMTRALAPGGYLFLGHAETLRGLSQEFHLCHTHGTFYYQRRGPAEIEAPVHAHATSSPWSEAPALVEMVDHATTWVDAIQQAAERVHALTERASGEPDAIAPPAPDHLGGALDLLQKERFTESLDLVHRLPAESQDDPDVLLLRALLLAHGGQLEPAEQVCKQLLSIDELNAGAHYVLALCREGAGDGRGAADHDQLAVYLDPLFAMPRLHLGLLARRSGDRESACRELAQALLLFTREDASRVLFFGGGFNRDTLIALCRAELEACGGHP